MKNETLCRHHSSVSGRYEHGSSILLEVALKRNCNEIVPVRTYSNQYDLNHMESTYDMGRYFIPFYAPGDNLDSPKYSPCTQRPAVVTCIVVRRDAHAREDEVSYTKLLRTRLTKCRRNILIGIRSGGHVGTIGEPVRVLGDISRGAD